MKGSLILVLRYHSTPYFANIVEIDLNELPEKPTEFPGPYTGPGTFKVVARLKQGGNQLVEKPTEFPGPYTGPGTFKVVARLKQGGNELVDAIGFKVCSLAAQTGGCSITPDLCVFPYSGPGVFRKDTPLSGYIFNLRTGAMEKLKPPATPKLSAYLVSLKGDIYYFSDPSFLLSEPDCLPERYCHEKKSWEPLKPFPLSKSGRRGVLCGYAVFDDFILFNMGNSFDRQLLAYDCSSGNWHVVTVDNRECYDFEGLGVVVETTLYALTPWSSSIIALSITRGPSDHGDVVFSCCLGSKFNLSHTYHPNLVVHEPIGSDHLVHFGDLEFCLVRTGYCNFDYRNQELKIMVLRLEESQNLATLIHAMDYKIGLGKEFRLSYCFLLPPDLDLVVSKQEDESDDIDFAFDIQNINPVGNGRRRKGGRRKKKSGKSKSCGGDNGEGSGSQMGSK